MPLKPKKKGISKVTPKKDPLECPLINCPDQLSTMQQDITEMKTLLHTFLGNSRPGLFQSLEGKVTSLQKLVYIGLGVFSLAAVAMPFIARAIWH